MVVVDARLLYIIMYLNLSSVLTYLNCNPNSRCFIEGERILNSDHLVMCGIKEKNGENWIVKAYCIQGSGIKLSPHEISGVFKVTDHVEIMDFQCTCKAGASGSCKHLTAALLFCTRKPVEDLDQLSCTDMECMWKKKKPVIEKKYESHVLRNTKCFQKNMTRETLIHLEKGDIDKIFEQAVKLAPNSEFSLHLRGRRQKIEFAKNNSQPVIALEFINQIFDNSVQSLFLPNLDIDTNPLPQCCKNLIDSMKGENIKEAMSYDQGSTEWKVKRRNRITGTTCYPIYTFKKNDWTTMLKNFFNPKNVTTKQMSHGIETEAVAFETFQNNNLNYEIKKIGIIISHLYPWLAFSPDGVTFCNGKPSRLLEIKCPYLGKIKSAEEVVKTLPYLKEYGSLKENHGYYAQIQMGMALLNLEYCDFIVFFSKDRSYLHITVPFNPDFAKVLLETASKKYLTNMIHYICVHKFRLAQNHSEKFEAR